MLFVIYLALIGSCIGSFANVVIYRLPAQKSVVWPRSSCPHCHHTLSARDLIPIVSWAVLKGRCRYCQARVAWRYPFVELLSALGFGLIAWHYSPVRYGWTCVPLIIIFSLFVMMSFIDWDYKILPDILTLPALVTALAGTFLYAPESGLPTFPEALWGAAIGAGVITMINRLGGLVLRGFKDTRERLWPISMDQVGIGALGGALGGWQIGLVSALASLLLNLITRRVLRIPEWLSYGLWLLTLIALPYIPWMTWPKALGGTLVASGTVALMGLIYWQLWLQYELHVAKRDPDALALDEVSEASEEELEPVAMGLGDVKLAAVMGAMLGWQGLILALLIAVFSGAFFGIITKSLGGTREIPFGPYLALGAMVALFVGNGSVIWYLQLIGLA